jgi:outer membrane protein
MRLLDRRHAVSMAVAALVGFVLLFPAALAAETMRSALARAYQGNPQLNAERARVRVTDETVPQALSGYRPSVSASGSLSGFYSAPARTATSGTTANSASVGVNATQTLFNGFQTANRTRSAEMQVQQARQGLRVIEHAVLLNAATAYMDVLRDNANLGIQQSNVRALTELLRLANERARLGEVTPTDVAQAEAQLAAAHTALHQAEAALRISRANYRQVIGVDPGDLAPGAPVDRLSPRTLAAATDRGLAENPNVTAAMYGVDVAYLQVKIGEGGLLPVVSIGTQAQYSTNPAYSSNTASIGSSGTQGANTTFSNPAAYASQTEPEVNASVVGQVSVPLYQGGADAALIRQSKETLGQQRILLDQTRDQVRQQVAQAWARLEAAKVEVQDALTQVAAAEKALNGVRQEARVGARTTFDVLYAQQVLVTARLALVVAQHERVVSSYTLLASVGGLSPRELGLPTPTYDPMVHYDQVRDAWGGLRTPGGR